MGERLLVWLNDIRSDAGYAVRLLRRNPVMAATAVLSLAIGIGANTAIFTLANALLLRAPFGVAEPDRLVDIGVGRGDGGFNPGSYPTYLDLRQRTTTLDGVYAHQMFTRALRLGIGATTDGAERIVGQFVTLNYFDVLGAHPAAGRLFGAGDDERRGASPLVVLSHRFWARRFNSDPAVVGREIQLNGQPFGVTGVATEGFQGTGLVAADVWLPLNMFGSVNAQGDAIFTGRANGWLVMGGRLKPGVSVAAAAAEADAIGRALAREHPEAPQAAGLRVLPSSSVPGNGGPVAAFVVLLTVLVSLVLLVACANLSGILLARAAARRREMAVRLAIGAGRWRIMRQLLTETLILFLLGGAAGLALARGVTSLVLSGLPSLPFPISLSLALDTRVVVFTAGLSLIAALLSGLAPALHASKDDIVSALKDDAQGPSGRARLRQVFVVAQVAFSIVLVVSAGLFARALARAGAIDSGFDPREVELVSVDLSMAGYGETTGPALWRNLIASVRQLAGVETATLARVLPGGFEGIGLGDFTVPGAAPDRVQLFEPDWNIVEPGYFATLRIPLVAGRDFTDEDSASTQPVVIVGEAAARYFWPGQNAVGKYMLQRVGAGATRTTRPVLVIGVARDVKSSSLIDGLSESFVYLPLQQQYSAQMTSTMTIVTRTAQGGRAADAIRVQVASIDPNLSVVASQTLEDSVALGLVPQRVAASVAGSLGMVGLLLAAIGIYGVTAFMVTRRLREFGIRLALGARRSDIVRMVVAQGTWLTAIGCAIGLTLAALAAQLLSVFLFGVPPLDPLTFVGAAVLFAVVGLVACYGPARRATTVDPLIALRHE